MSRTETKKGKTAMRHTLIALLALSAALPASAPAEAARRDLDAALARTDPELAETFGYFAFDEIIAQTPLIDPRTRARITLAALVASGSPATFRETLAGALEAGMPPEEAKEILYQAVPYLGFAKARECLDVANDVLRARGVALPLARQGTTTRETRFERGLAIQVETFGEGMREALENAPADLRHIRRNLAANCFGDVYTRRGLDMKARELLTFAMLVSLGGCDAQVRGHIAGNLAVGNNRATLIQAATALLPYIGYPRTLNALSAIDAVAPADGQK